MLTAPTVGKTLPMVGRKNMIIIGYIVTIAATVAFGVCYHIPKMRELKYIDPVTKEHVYDYLEGG